MKKSWFTLSLIPIIVAPTIMVVSCGGNTSTNYKGQYDLFTPKLVKTENVPKNLAFSIDQKLVKNIYSIPSKLNTFLDYSFAFAPSEDGTSLTLWVQLYNERGDVIPYSSTSNMKEITTINGFKVLTATEQAEINQQYQNLQDLVLEGDITKLPSNIKSFSDIPGSNAYIEDPKFIYDFKFIDSNNGTLGVELFLSSKPTETTEKYPLRADSLPLMDVKEVLGFKTYDQYQKEIDDAYNLITNIDVKKYPSLTNVPYGSSIKNSVDLAKFYELLNASTSIPEDIIKIPPFLKTPDSFQFRPEIIIDSYDIDGKLNITINFHDRLSGILLTPSSSVSRTKYINNLAKATPEMLKATMDAYKLFSTFNSKPEYVNQLASKVYADVAITNPFQISDFPENLTKEFSVTVDTYPSNENENPTTQETFFFRPTFVKKSFNDEIGEINFSIELEIKKDGPTPQYFLIKPPLSVSLSTQGRPTFNKAKQENTLSVIKFLTTSSNAANTLYEQIITKIKAFTNNTMFGPDQTDNEFSDANFVLLWDSLTNPPLDQLGLPLKNDVFKIKYTFVKSKLGSKDFDVYSSVVGGITYKWVKVQAAVYSAFNSDFKYEFLNINNVVNPILEFNFAIKAV